MIIFLFIVTIVVLRLISIGDVPPKYWSKPND